MATKIHLSVVSPEREVVNVEVDELTAPGWDGEFGVLPNHAPFLALMSSGELSYRIGSEVHSIAVGFGFVEVLADKVNVMIETAEKQGEIDLDRAVAARERAEELLSQGTSDIDFDKAQMALQRAISRVKVAKKAKGVSNRATEAQFRH